VWYNKEASADVNILPQRSATQFALPKKDNLQLGISHYIHVQETLDAITFHECLDIVIDSGISYRKLGYLFGYCHITVRSWHLRRAMPTDECVIPVIRAWALQIQEIQNAHLRRWA